MYVCRPYVGHSLWERIILGIVNEYKRTWFVHALFIALSAGTRGNAVPTPFLPRLCLLVYFISTCNANVIMRSLTSQCLPETFFLECRFRCILCLSKCMRRGSLGRSEGRFNI